MSSSERIPHARGMEIARDVAQLIAGTYTRLAIAGSLRRGKPDVGDVEFVIRPYVEGAVNRLHERMVALEAAGVVTKRLKSNGTVYAYNGGHYAFIFKGVNVELWGVRSDRGWGPTMITRTGPGDAGKVLVTKDGVINSDGNRGILPHDLRFHEGGLWRGDELLDTPEELDVFAACGLSWLPPSRRSVASYQRISTFRKELCSIDRFAPMTCGNQYMHGAPIDALDDNGRPYWVALPPPVREWTPATIVEQVGMFEEAVRYG